MLSVAERKPKERCVWGGGRLGRNGDAEEGEKKGRRGSKEGERRGVELRQ